MANKAKPKPILIRRNTDHAAMQSALAQVPTERTEAPAPIEQIQVESVAHVASPIRSAANQSTTFADLEVGKEYDLPLASFQKSRVNARVFYTNEELDETAKSLLDHGQEVAAKGYVRSGKVVLVDGQKRLHAMTIASLPTLRVYIDSIPKDEKSEYEQSRRINLIRSSQTAIDDAVRWKGLLDDSIYGSQVELAEAMGLKPPQVSKILKINDVPEKLLKIMIEHPSTRTASNAYQISQIFRSEKFASAPEEAEILAEEIIEVIKNERTSKDNVEALIKSKMDGPKQRVRGEVESVRFGDVKGTLKVFPSRGQIDLSFKDLPEARVALLKQKIEQMLRSE